MLRVSSRATWKGVGTGHIRASRGAGRQEEQGQEQGVWPCNPVQTQKSVRLSRSPPPLRCSSAAKSDHGLHYISHETKHPTQRPQNAHPFSPLPPAS